MNLSEPDGEIFKECKYASIGLALISVKGNFLSVNESLIEMLGYSEGEFKSKSLSAITFEEDFENDLNEVQDLLDKKIKAYQVHKRLIHKNGLTIWTLLNVSLVLKNDGSAKCMFIQIQDINKSKLLEGIQHLVLESTVDGFWDWHFPQDYQYMSSRFWETLGYNPKTKKHHPSQWKEIIFDEDLDLVLQNFEKHIATEGKHPFEQRVRYLHQDGSTVWMLSKGKVIEWDENGKPIRMVGTHTDITEHKRTEEQLMHVQKMEAVGRLSGGIAHDFNNKLGAIMMTSNLLLHEVEPGSKAHQKISNIIEISQKAAELTKQLLAFGRKQVMNLQVYDVNDLISKSLKLITPVLREDIKLETKLKQNLGNIRVDSVQINQVLLNLVVNARDAIVGSGKVTIKTGEHYFNEDEAKIRNIKPGTYASLSVADTGIGIDKKDIPQIFEPFFTTKKEYEGTGLGLAMVQGIVKQSNGHLWVYSEVGSGSTFTMYFPMVDESLSTVNMSNFDETKFEGSANILLVEDEEFIRTATTTVLEKYGYNVQSAINGKEALSVCKESDVKFDLLITDVIMPELNGKELADMIAVFYPEIPIIFTSGYSDDVLRDLEKINNPYLYIQKPIQAEILLTEVHNMLSGNFNKTVSKTS